MWPSAPRPCEVVHHIECRAELHGEVGGANGGPREAGAVLAALADGRQAADGVELAEEEREKIQPCHRQPDWVSKRAAWANKAAGRRRAGMFDQKTSSALRAIRRWSRGAGVIIRRRDLVQDPAARVIQAAIASPAEAETQVDVLVIGSEGGDRNLRPDGCLGAATGSSGWRRRPRRIGRAVHRSAGCGAPLLVGQPPACKCRRGSLRDRGRCGRGPAWPLQFAVGSAKGARPACSQPCDTSVSLLSNWMKWPRASAIPALAAARSRCSVQGEPPIRSGIDRPPSRARCGRSGHRRQSPQG